MNADTKLVPCVMIGDRNGATANEFISDLASRLRYRVQMTGRTPMRRYTRLSNGFSRKIENHIAAVALNYFGYNFIKIHTTPRKSPAMAAGVTDRLFDAADLVALLAESESKKAA